MKHQFCVYDICNLHALQGTVVLAGKAYLDNIINHVNVMEVPDIENWVQANEFLMTTGYMYKDSPLQFAELIPKLKERGVAALGIKPKRFLDSIPDGIIACAEEYGLPLLLLPEQTAFSLVIRECMEKILLNEKGRQSTFLKNLLLGHFPSEQEIYTNAEQISFDFPMNRLYTLLLIVEHEDHVMYEKEAIYQTLKYFFTKMAIPAIISFMKTISLSSSPIFPQDGSNRRHPLKSLQGKPESRYAATLLIYRLPHYPQSMNALSKWQKPLNIITSKSQCFVLNRWASILFFPTYPAPCFTTIAAKNICCRWNSMTPNMGASSKRH